MILSRAGLLATALVALLALAACSTTAAGPAPHADAHAGAWPEASPYDPQANAQTDLAAALAAAAAAPQPRRVLAVWGANWCHDSRALAGWLQSPALAPLVAAGFEVVYIDSGVPQTGEGRHLDLAAHYGVAAITGTPTLLVLDADGTLLNTPADARAWRNAASRSEDDIRAFLERWTDAGVTPQ